MIEPTPASPAPEDGERLSKRISRMMSCSRSEAEQYIAGGFVTVDGCVVEAPQFRVLDQQVAIAAGASLAPVLPVTLLWHKPAGATVTTALDPANPLLNAGNRFAGDRSGIRTLARHIRQQVCVSPLEPQASGLVVFSQDPRVKRKLQEEAALIEHETMVDVRGIVSDEVLARLNETPVIDGRAMLAAKVSRSRQAGESTGLRFAVKGNYPDQIRKMCQAVNLQLLASRRIRIGRMPVAGLQPGQWRYLLGYERF